LFNDLWQEGYFEKTFPSNVVQGEVDAWIISKKPAEQRAQERFYIETQQDCLPLFKGYTHIDADALLKTIELSFQFISNSEESSEDRKAIFLKKINVLLHKCYLEMDSRGKIVNYDPSDAFKDAIDKSTESIPKSIKEKIDHAQELFKKGDNESKRNACETLGLLLEPLKNEIKSSDLSKDSNELFGIINKFGIRHNNKNTKQIDDPILLDWIFRSLLNVAVTFFDLKKRQDKER